MKDFLEQPLDSCRTILTLGEPHAGKTYNFIRCVAYWLQNETFDEIHLVLPVYKYEQNNSYAFLSKYKGKTKIKIYNAFHDQIAHNLIKQQEADKKGKKIFLGVDDSTQQASALFASTNLVKLATTSRHLRIHTWLLMHYNKSVIPPKVRKNLGYIFVFELGTEDLDDVFRQYMQRSMYKDRKEFFADIDNNLVGQQYGCMLIDKIRKKVTFDSASWWG
jgi:hypothetical protein